MSKTVYIGLEGSGKTYLMGMDTMRIIDRNAYWAKKTGVMRPIVSNMVYTQRTIDYANSKGVPIRYWSDIEELSALTECDLFIDEIGAYFDSRNFADLPLDVRLWLAQAQKLGVYIYGGAQDWAQIDASYRRLVKRLYEVRKVVGSRRPAASVPTSSFVWGLIFAFRLSPGSDSDSTTLKTISWLPDFFFIRKKWVKVFDTNARVKDSAAPPLKRVVRHWYNEKGEIGYTRVRYV